MSGAEPADNLVGEFLTEAGELIEQLDADLVRLEAESASKPLLDQIFRALHTIKGAASFLDMPAVTSFAHAAEDALNQLRKGEAEITPEIIDALLQSVDVLRGQLEELASGDPLTPGPPDLIDRLAAIAASAADAAAELGEPAGGAPRAPEPATPASGAGETLEGVPALRRPLDLSAGKADIVPLMGDELAGAAEDLDRIAERIESGASGADVGAEIDAVIAGLVPTVEFFDVASLTTLHRALDALGSAVRDANGPALDAGADALRRAGKILSAYGAGLASGEELVFEASVLESGLFSPQPAPTPEAPAAGAQGASEQPQGEPRSAQGMLPQRKEQAPKAEGGAGAEQTVRVEVKRLESLLNLVGELVLTKNQILGMSRQLRLHELPHELLETIHGAAGDLDRLTGEMQMGVMRTRMQPLSKLFGRYPRIVRDLARTTGKQITLEISGGETEVDKSVLEQLADPMVHILRNSADHGIEAPEDRVRAGKAPGGTIRLRAEHQGGHVRVEIADDGKGIDPEVVATKAAEKGLITPEQGAQMSDQEKVNLVFAPGFSTAAKVSDLSGRGVGMDVVRTNINKLGGTINLRSEKGNGSTIEVLIPLTVAIMPAMMVTIGANDYAVPIACVIEIVRLERGEVHSVAGRPVIRLRETVLPLVFMRERLGESCERPGERFAVVVEVGQQRAGLVVDQLVGQQEVVIKPLDDIYTSGGPFSGATIREDGDVSLILDANQLIRSVQQGAELQAA